MAPLDLTKGCQRIALFSIEATKTKTFLGPPLVSMSNYSDNTILTSAASVDALAVSLRKNRRENSRRVKPSRSTFARNATMRSAMGSRKEESPKM